MTRTGKAVLESAHLSLEYDLDSGRACLLEASARPLILNATASVILAGNVVRSAEVRYRRYSSVTTTTVAGTAGTQLVVSCRDTHRQVALELRFTLLHDRPGALFELVLTNVSPHDLVLQAAEP
jgi:hypothetical protein